MMPFSIFPDYTCTAMAMDQDFTHHSSVNCPSDAPLWRRSQHSVHTLYTMMAQEVNYTCSDYLRDDNLRSIEVPKEITDTTGLTVTEDDRKKIVDWCYSLVDLCQLSRESVAMAMNIVDRFMSKPSQPHVGNGISPSFSHQEILHDRNMYQLLAVSALYIAIKMNERVVLSSDRLSAVCRGIYTRESIEAMERTILSCLSWRVSAPTALQVGSIIFELMIAEAQEAIGSVMDAERFESIQEELTYQTEIAVRDYLLAVQRPSTVAFMAILNSIAKHRKGNRCEEEEHLLKALGNILLHVESMTLYDIQS
jgi:hypothetical protein